MRSSAPVALVALLIGASSCSRSCLFGEVIAKDDGPPRATLDYVEGIPGRSVAKQEGRLRIDSKPWRETVICNEQPKTGAVVVEPGGKRIAARCNQGPWTVVELGGEDRTIKFCPFAEDPSKNWKSAPSVEKNAVDSLGCGDPTDRFTAVTAELRSRKNPRATADFMMAAASRYPADGWLREYAALDAPTHQLLATELCGSLAKKEASAHVLDLALRACDLSDDRHLDPLVAHLTEPKLDRKLHESLWQWGVLRVMRARGKEITAAVCASFDEHSVQDTWFPMMVLGHIGAKCLQVERLPLGVCPGDVACGAATCTQKELQARHEKVIDAALATKAPRPAVPELALEAAEAELAFRYAQGPVKLSSSTKGCDAGSSK